MLSQPFKFYGVVVFVVVVVSVLVFVRFVLVLPVLLLALCHMRCPHACSAHVESSADCLLLLK